MKTHHHEKPSHFQSDREHLHGLEEEVSVHKKKIRKKLEEKLEHRRLKRMLSDFDEWH